jgi:hypothetical protein
VQRVEIAGGLTAGASADGENICILVHSIMLRSAASACWAVCMREYVLNFSLE